MAIVEPNTDIWLVWLYSHNFHSLKGACLTEETRDKIIDSLTHYLREYHGAFYPPVFDEKLDSNEITTQLGERIYWNQMRVIT